MKNATALHPDRLTLNAAVQAPAQMRLYHTVVRPDHDAVERRWREFNGRAGRCRKVRSVCREMLIIAGLGILLYSAAMLLQLAG